MKNIIKKILKPIYFLFCRVLPIEKLRYYISSFRNPIRVGFIVQMPAVWDKLEPIYNIMSSKKNYETFLLVTPVYDFENSKVNNNYDNNYYLKKYSNNVFKTVKENGDIFDLASLNLNYVFFERPYDHYLPEGLRSYNIVNCSKVCHIPYGYRCSPDFDDVIINNPFFDYTNIVFCDSCEQLQVYKSYSNKRNFRDDFQLLNIGYPSFEIYLDYYKTHQQKEVKSVMWTPRFTYDEKIGGSHFFEYKDTILNKDFLNDTKLIFRPHPLMFDNFIKEGLMSNEDKSDILNKINQIGGIFDSSSTIKDSIFESDVLITDISSLIVNYFITGKPIIYCPWKYNASDEFQQIIDCMYIANNESELIEHYNNLLKGNDYLRTKRLEVINNKFLYHRDAGNRIVDYLYKDRFGLSK